MSIIYKYELNEYETWLDLPKESKILTVQNQRNLICLWVWIDQSNLENVITRKFTIFGTGIDIPMSDKKYHYIGTVQIDWTVWHVFEELKDSAL